MHTKMREFLSCLENLIFAKKKQNWDLAPEISLCMDESHSCPGIPMALGDEEDPVADEALGCLESLGRGMESSQRGSSS